MIDRARLDTVIAILESENSGGAATNDFLDMVNSGKLSHKDLLRVFRVARDRFMEFEDGIAIGIL